MDNHLSRLGAGVRSGSRVSPRRVVPPDPTAWQGVLPRALVAQSEGVLVGALGYVYLTDKNHGLYVLRYDGLGG